MRRFVVIGQSASASADFSLLDLPGTSGRLDVLLRCLRAALLVSHGSRRDTIVYLVLLGGARAPRTLRVDGAAVRFIRPDERSLGSMAQKALGRVVTGEGFQRIRDGIDVADGGIDVVLADVDRSAWPKPTTYVLREGAGDVRDAALDTSNALFFVGDHLGFDEASRARIDALAPTAIGVGPLSLHADDAITVVSNELDRREAAACR